MGRLKPQPFREVKRRLEGTASSLCARLSDGRLASTHRSHAKFIRRLDEIVDTVIVPKKREIPVGTLRSILNQAHIDPDQWDKLG